MAEQNEGATTGQEPGAHQEPSVSEGAAAAPATPPQTAGAETAGTQASPAITPQEQETPEAKAARLEAEVGKARTLQAQADRRAKRERAARIRAEKRLNQRGGSSFEEPEDDIDPPQPATNSNEEVERAKAERLMVQKAYSDPKYRAVVDADPTLKRLLETNPLALVNDPVDAQDAADQLEELLDERVSTDTPPSPTTKPTAPTGQEAPPSTQKTEGEFTPGATNPVTPPNSPAGQEKLKSGDFGGAIDEKFHTPGSWNKPAAE